MPALRAGVLIFRFILLRPVNSEGEFMTLKARRVLLLVLMILLSRGLLCADSVVHKFELWGKGTDVDRLNLYWGWTNGFLQASGPRGVELAVCLDGMTTTQALAMIDKRFKEHPELWSHPLGEQILNALTAEGGPCQGKNPLTPTP